MGITLKYIKPLFYWLPELYLVLSVIFYWVSAASLFNPIAFILLVLLVSQLIFNKKRMGIFLGSLLILLNLYLFLAFFSDVVKISEITFSAQKFLLMGSIYLSLNLLMSIKLLIKHLEFPSHQTEIQG